MSWSDDEIDELLTRYLDRELSSEERSRVELMLGSDAILRQRLADWKELKNRLGQLEASASSNRRELGSDFAHRVIRAAQTRMAEANDPELAPWIPRQPEQPRLDLERRLRERDGQIPANEPTRVRRSTLWLLGVVATGLAASLLIIAFWSPPMEVRHSLLSQHEPVIESNESIATNHSPIVIEEPNERIEIDQKESPLAPSSLVKKEPNTGLPDRPSTAPLVPPDPSDLRSTSSEPRIASGNRPMANESPIAQGMKPETSSLEIPSLEPTAEQKQMLEQMLKNATGSLVFVVDISLPSDVADLDSVREVLDRHDIAWSSQLELDESAQSALAASRMIEEAGKQGYLPDYVVPPSKGLSADRDPSSAETVSLLFVKARGSRLDGALVELMKRVDEFPEFSFDLAYDPPTQSLADELRHIQEASLLSSPLSIAQSASPIVRRGSNLPDQSVLARFRAGPRRSASMNVETRRQAKLALDPEMMNPISYALLIVRYPGQPAVR